VKLLRLGNSGQEILAAIDRKGKYRNLSSHLKDLNPETINFENLEKLKKIDLESLEEIDQSSRIGSCITKPGNFFAIGLNYIEHAKETGAEPPKNPVLFNKSVHSIVGPNDKGGQWVKGKSGDTFGPIGPYLVTKDEIKDIENMNLFLDVNGNRHQTGNTNQMIFNFSFLVAHISSFITLMPGDIVTTGTPPGVGLGMNPPVFLKEGDKMKLSVDNLGMQNIKVVAE
jgi:2,4-diketo-3-deoxy-L-fuconate hydrolase